MQHFGLRNLRERKSQMQVNARHKLTAISQDQFRFLRCQRNEPIGPCSSSKKPAPEKQRRMQGAIAQFGPFFIAILSFEPFDVGSQIEEDTAAVGTD